MTTANRYGPTRPPLLATLAACALVAVAPDGLRAQTEVDSSGLELINPETQEAIDAGLEYLASRQHPDGSVGSGSYSQSIAVTSLAGLAWLSAGNTPGRGRYGENVELAVEFVLENTSPSGFVCVPSSTSHGPMYDHGFGTLFLAEVYGMTTRPDLRDRLRENLVKAVNLIVQTQNHEGGWRYQPVPRDADISVTVCQIMALRAARNAGIAVSRETVDRCIEYVRRSQNPDGGFRYMIQGGQSAFPRSAAGVVALFSAGIYEGQEIEDGLNYLMRHLPRGSTLQTESHYFYGHYYAVQAMWHAGADYWPRWYEAIREELLARRSPQGGYWADPICNEYGTAMACIVLQMPNNYLPIFQR